MKRTQITRPASRKSRARSQEPGSGLLPLTAREFLKLPGVLDDRPAGRPDEPGDRGEPGSPAN